MIKSAARRLSARRSARAAVFLLATTLQFTLPAAAVAGFDCGKASTPMGTLICGNKQLGTLDAALTHAYRQKRGNLDLLVKKELQSAQDEWLLRRNWECHIPLKGPATVLSPQIDCLTRLYRNRIAELEGKPLPNDEDKVELLFSADDFLCKPLRNLYDRLAHIYRFRVFSEGVSRIDLNWEEVYRSEFQAIGLIEPHGFPESTRLSFAKSSTWYNVDLADRGKKQLVNIEDQSIGQSLDATFGSYGTNVWILKPGANVQVETLRGGPYGPVTTFRPDIIEMAVLFAGLPFSGGPRDQYREVKSPYFFSKTLSRHEASLPLSQRMLRDPFVGAPGVPQVQRLFRFGRRFVITERTMLGGSTALVYRFAGDRSIEDLCYLGARLKGKERSNRDNKGN